MDPRSASPDVESSITGPAPRPPAPGPRDSGGVIHPPVRRRVTARAALIAAAFAVTAIGGHALMDLMVGSPLRRSAATPGPAVAISHPSFPQLAGALIQAPLQQGNRFEIVSDGETFERVLADLEGARHSVTLQLYYCQDGGVSRRLFDALVASTARGVQVLFIPDGFGCRDLPPGYRDRLLAAGIRVETFRPVRWYSLHRAQHRSHVRALVVDGRVGYTGGFGLDDKWAPAGGRGEWREANVRFTGPAVAQMQGAFAAAWAEVAGEMLSREIYFPAPTDVAAGPQVGALAYSVPSIGVTVAERLLALSIASARSTLYITNSYFVPDADFRALLKQAAGRGVDVRIMTAGRETDVPTTRLAGRATYAELLEAGVRIYEYQPVMMHAKTLVADSRWLSIGTMNFDNRSLRLNEEAAVVSLDESLGSQMDSIFRADLANATEVTVAAFRARPWIDRILEQAASAIWFLL